MPTLRELKATFVQFERRAYPKDEFVDGVKHTNGWGDIYHHTQDFAQADGLWFMCPKSYAAEGDNGHFVCIWFEGRPVPPDVGVNKDGQTVRWKASGTSIDDLVLAPSILEQSGACGWHGFVGSSDVPAGSAA